MLEREYKKIEIAWVIGINKSTITRKIKCNADGRNGIYLYELAQHKALERKRLKLHAIALTPEIMAYIERKHTQDRWIPAENSGRASPAKLEGIGYESTTTIYRHIAADRKAVGTLHKYLRQSKPYRKPGGKYSDGRGSIRNRQYISKIPAEVETKTRFGDLEIDTVIGSNHKGALLTINYRLTGYLWITKLDGKNATELAATEAFMPWKAWLKTITADNGKEFAEHEKIAKDLEILFFFAQSYHSWERVANENANDLIRKFFPKKMPFGNITEEQVQWVKSILNNRPRKRLGFLTPTEMLNKFLFNKKVAFAA